LEGTGEGGGKDKRPQKKSPWVQTCGPQPTASTSPPHRGASIAKPQEHGMNLWSEMIFPSKWNFKQQLGNLSVLIVPN
jgi:hypothetical protein